jgi:hypothetical protein
VNGWRSVDEVLEEHERHTTDQIAARKTGDRMGTIEMPRHGCPDGCGLTFGSAHAAKVHAGRAHPKLTTAEVEKAASEVRRGLGKPAASYLLAPAEPRLVARYYVPMRLDALAAIGASEVRPGPDGSIEVWT